MVILLLVVAVATGMALKLPDALLARVANRPEAGSVPIPGARADPELERRLVEVLRGTAGVSVAIQEVRTGASAEISGSEQFVAASLFKLPIIAETTARIHSGTLDPDRKLEIRQDHWTDGAGVLQARVGDRVPVRELLKLMVQESDNVAALVLLDQLGTAELNRAMASWGMRATRLADRHTGGPSEHLTTASDMRTLLIGLAGGRIGGPEASEEALALLELPQAHGWLAGELPPFTRIAHKWGSLPPKALHDAGIVYGPRATFAIAVLSDGGTPAERERLIARVSRAAYDYFTR